MEQQALQVNFVSSIFKSLNTDVNWAIAGRDQDKLQKVASDNSVDVEMLIADSDDEVALDILTSRAKVILSTTGPFHRYGSKLVASCVKNSAQLCRYNR